jgi:hypothetical protein
MNVKTTVQSSKEFVPARIICVPIDKTSDTNQIIDHTIKNIATVNDHVILIHGRDTTDDYPTTTPFVGYGISSITLMRLEKSFRDDSERLLQSNIEKFNAKNIVVRGVSVKRNWIERKINELDPNLVVIGRRQRKNVCKNSLGLYLFSDNQYDFRANQMNVSVVRLWNI